MCALSAATAHPPAGALDRVPPVGLVLTGIGSVQVGAAVAATIFDEVGPSGATLLRLGMAALVAAVVFRPDLRGRSAADLRLGALFGLTLGVMNLAFYEALDRIPLGIAVTIEFAGPLGSPWRCRAGAWTTCGRARAAGIVLSPTPAAAAWIPSASRSSCSPPAAGRRTSSSPSARAGLPGPQRHRDGAHRAALVPSGPGIAQGGAELLEPRLLLIGLLVGVASSVIPYTLETEALRRMPAHAFGVLMSLEPAVAALAGFVILGQALGSRELLAMGLVVAASIGVTRRQGSGAPPPVDP
jgi:inner membrane transporter RhtA